MDSSARDLIRLTWPAPRVALVCLNSPTTRNALSRDLVAALCAALRELDKDGTAAVAVLAGSGTPPICFCAGFDVTELARLPISETLRTLDLLVSTLVDNRNDGRISIPIVAAVAGSAVGGGCELALACDVVYATADARFALPETQLGLVPAGGAICKLPGAVGMGRAADLLLTGRPWSGKEAESWGMVRETFDEWDACLEAAITCAKAIADNGPRAVKITKELLGAREKLPPEALLLMARRSLEDLLTSEEHVDRRTAWLSRKR